MNNIEKNTVFADVFQVNPDDYRDIHIDEIVLRTRVRRVLKENGICNVGILLEKSKEGLLKYKKFGKMCMDELSKTLLNETSIRDIDRIKRDSIFAVFENEDSTICFGDALKLNKDEYLNMDLLGMEMSQKLRNCLFRARRERLGDLLQMSPSDILEMSGMGEVTRKELYDKILNMEFIEKATGRQIRSGDEEAYRASKNARKNILKRSYDEIDSSRWASDITPYVYSFTDDRVVEKKIFNMLGESRLVRDVVNVDFQRLDQDDFNCFIRLVKWLNFDLSKHVDAILRKVSRWDKVDVILRERAGGRNLHGIGQMLGGITRERVRQIEARAVGEFGRLDREHKIIYMISAVRGYDKVIQLSEIRDVIGEHADELIYLLKKLEPEYYHYNQSLNVFMLPEENSDVIMGLSPAEMLATLTSVDTDLTQELEEIKALAEERVYQGYLNVDGERIEPSRAKLMGYVMQKYCQSQKKAGELFDIYNKVVVRNNLPSKYKYPNVNTLYNRLLYSDNVICSHGRIFRYFSYDGFNGELVADRLNIAEMRDGEYTTMKFFNENKEQMAEWGLRDEYELHNLLKRMLGDDNEYDIRFIRSPGFEKGECNRERQIYELLEASSPIREQVFFRLYEMEYGIKVETLKANHIGHIDKYLCDGVYDISGDELTDEQKEKLNQAMSEDLYILSEVKNIFKELYPEEDMSKITIRTMKRMGLRVHRNIIFRFDSNRFEKFIREYIMRHGIFDSDTIPSEVKMATPYYFALTKLLNRRDIVEVEKGVYITASQLNKIGIAKEDLEKFANQVYDFFGTEIFTIKYLSDSDFKMPFEDEEFGHCFYESIIKYDGRFSSNVIKGQRFFSSVKNEIREKDIVQRFVKNAKIVDMADLGEIMGQRYGLRIGHQRLVGYIKEVAYYNDASGQIYVNHEDYISGRQYDDVTAEG